MTYRLVLFAFLGLMINVAALAQVTTEQQLVSQLETARGDARIEVLVALVDTLRTTKPQLAIEYGNEGLALLATQPNAMAEVDILNEMSWAYRVQGNHAEALRTGEQSLSLAQEAGYTQGEARAFNNIGVVYFYLGDNDRALAAWLQALAAREAMEDSAGIAGSLNNIGLVYTRQGELESAIANFNRALDISSALGKDEFVLNHLDNLGEAYTKLGDFAAAEQSYQSALEIADSGNYLEGKVSVLVNMGALALNRGELAAAKDQLAAGKALAESLGGLSKQAEAGLYLARVQEQENEFELAIGTADTALGIAGNLAEKLLIRDLEAVLARLHEQTGDYAQALGHLKAFNTLQADLLNSERQNTIALLQTRFEVAENEKEIALLEADSARQNLALESAQALSRIAQIATVFVTLLAVGLVLTLRIRNRSRALLATTAANYNQLLESLSLGVMAVDGSGAVSFSNDALKAIIGSDAEALRRLQNEAESMLADNAAMAEWQLMLSGRPAKSLLLVVERRLNDTGEESGLWLIVTDLSEQKATSAQLVQASKLATLGEMSTGMAHELNQPLNVISLAATNLRLGIERNKADTQFVLDKLDRINSAVGRAAHIIDHMRAYGRVADEGMTPISIAAVVADTCRLLEEQLKLRNIKLSNNIDDPAMTVKGNAIQLEQVLLNIINNARDAVIATGDSGLIQLSAEYSDAHVLIHIQDTGGGIPEDVIPHIFEPFFTTKPVGQGTGLGGSISYGIIKDMQGDIWVENVGDGARFTIDLPLLAA